MEKISWMDKVTNEDVLKKVNESKNMLNVIRQRKRKWIGHGQVMCLDTTNSYEEIFEGRMKGRSTRGRKRIQLLDDLADGKDYEREAEDRSMWKIRQQRWQSRTCFQQTTERREEGSLVNCKFTVECSGERSKKIGQYLIKL